MAENVRSNEIENILKCLYDHGLLKMLQQMHLKRNENVYKAICSQKCWIKCDGHEYENVCTTMFEYENVCMTMFG